MMYHYCSLGNFLKIINSKELFLFNANNMNDRLETTWIIHLINEEINKRKEIIKEENIKMLNISFSLNRLYPYISCFSENEDSLSQWRAYADNGKGIAIGFNPEKFGIPNEIPVNTLVKSNSIGYFRCIYNINTQRRMINEILDILCLSINQGKTDEGDCINIATSFNKLSVVAKNPCFVEEREIRIIHIPMVMGDKDNNTTILSGISEIDFLAKNESISSYFRFELKSIFSSELIPEIILGPKNYVNPIELETYLSVNNLKKTIVRRSEASYI
jgi:hypothetical protein